MVKDILRICKLESVRNLVHSSISTVISELVQYETESRFTEELRVELQ